LSFHHSNWANKNYSLPDLITQKVIYVGLKKAYSWSDQLFLHPDLLFNAVESYYIDISRYKVFHRTKIIDAHKKAAYIIKWLSKVRPISYSDNISLKNPELKANQVFAIYAGICHFKQIEVHHIPKSLYKNLLYSTTYRDILPLQLSQTLYLMEKLGEVKLAVGDDISEETKNSFPKKDPRSNYS